MLKILPKPLKIIYKEGSVGEKYDIETDPGIPREGYRLILNKDGILIEASSAAGVFYAEKTLEQIKEQTDVLPCVEIEDRPKYPHRGFMLDCARHFFDIDAIKKQIEILSRLKMNVFHWHLTDDQGWRIEVKKYPELTGIGSIRRQTLNDGREVGGYYTREQIKETVEFCRERFIDVIPEIDMPGHFSAGIAAYPELGCTGKSSEVETGYGIFPEILCAGKDETLNFCRDLITETAELFPSKYFHIGGDEALKLRWYDCPNCRKRIKNENLRDEEGLQSWFMAKAASHLAASGKTPIVWNDGAAEDSAENCVVQYWKQGKKYRERAETLLKKNIKFIYSPFGSLYLDYPCGITPLRKVYNFKEDFDLSRNVRGLETALWSEYVPDEKTLETRIYPRIFAVADRAWAGEGDYAEFLDREKTFEKYILKYGITIDKDPNPGIFRRAAESVSFFAGVIKHTGKSLKYMLRSFARKRTAQKFK